MPIYEYSCNDCGNQYDKICRSGIPDSEITCPKCGNNNSKRKLSMFSFGSRTKSGDFKSAPSSGGCSSCSSGNCSHCHHH